MITPTTIKPMPMQAGASNDCLNMNTEISAVHTMPNPAQML